MTARTDEIFEKIVKSFCAIYHNFGLLVYSLYSKNGTPAELLKETENRIYSKAVEEFFEFLKLQPNIEHYGTAGLQQSFEAFTELVDIRTISMASVIMKCVKEYQIPLNPSKLLEKTIRSVMNEHYKKQKFFPTRKAPAAVQEMQLDSD